MIRRTGLAAIGAGLVVMAASTACGSEPEAAGVGTAVAVTVPSTMTPPTTAPATAVPSTTAAPTTAPTTSVAPTTAPPTTLAPTTLAPDTSRTLFDFLEAGAIGDWANVDDTVMGGVSSSTTSWDDGQMIFSGDLSLDNNGGFTSTRGPIDLTLGERLVDATAINVEATGDGNTYLLQLRTSNDELFVQRFSTVAGEERVYTLPLDAFEPVGRFLDPLPGAAPLQPNTIAQMVIYLLDKQEGPFRLAVGRIAAE